MAVAAMFLFCCQTPDRSLNKFADPVLLKIADLQDRRMPDSLYPYFDHKNVVYRKEAVQAFASLQDSGAVNKIGKLLLADVEPEVRKAAAFALGQIQNVNGESILLDGLMKEKDSGIVLEMLQSYGKTTKKWRHVRPSLLNDTTLAEGVAWSIYRAGLRGKTDSLANRVAKGLLDKKYGSKTRMVAAHYFSRSAKNFESAEKELILTSRNDPSAEVRMAAVFSLGKILSDSSLATLKNIIKNEKDSRVIINAIKALQAFPYKRIKNYLYEALGNKNINVGIAASEVIKETIIPEDWIEVSALTNNIVNWRIQANIYEAALKAGSSKALADEIKLACDKALNPYQKAALLGSLHPFPDDFEYVENQLRKADTALVRSAAASTLVRMNYSERFDPKLRTRFAEIFRNLMQSEDAAVMGIIAGALADSTLDFKKIIKDPSFLKDAKNKLRLPEDNEALQIIEAAIAHFENRKQPSLVKNEYNHPINWNLVKTISEDQTALIKTSKGSIRIRLLVNESPGTVANFVALALKNYFDNKFFHRVVPNFVVQAGCPRGDGWGGEDYSIRSEFSPRRYQTGSVGMASAGKDTEGTQWFITHSPTPHLDGRYTLFAEVVEGINVVHYLQVGDKILDVTLENLPAQ